MVVFLHQPIKPGDQHPVIVQNRGVTQQIGSPPSMVPYISAWCASEIDQNLSFPGEMRSVEPARNFVLTAGSVQDVIEIMSV